MSNSSLMPSVTASGAMILLTAALASAAPVKTNTGDVEGTTVAGSSVRVFKGIPYAAPAVGDLRWKPPQPATAWEGVRNFHVACDVLTVAALWAMEWRRMRMSRAKEG